MWPYPYFLSSDTDIFEISDTVKKKNNNNKIRIRVKYESNPFWLMVINCLLKHK